MTELTELVSLLYSAHRDIDGMVLTTRETIPRPASNVLIVGRDDTGAVRVRWTGGGPNGDPAGGSRRLWFQPPDRIRVEIIQRGGVVRAAVRDGSAWWRWDQDTGETAGNLQDGQDLPLLLDIPLLRPERLLQSMLLEVTGTRRRAGREVLAAIGTPRESPSGTQQHFEYEFDRKHGTPLYLAGTRDGEPTGVTEVIEANYAPEIGPDVFLLQKNDDYAPGTEDRQTRRPLGSSHTSRRNPRSGDPVMSTLGTVWLTGLSGAGKTTIAKATERLLHQLGITCCVLDGDVLRQGLSSDLGLSREDRGEQSRRVAHVAAILADSGVIPIVALVSPYASDRQYAREVHHARAVTFVEVWVDTPVSVCAARDQKGLYAMAGNIGSASADAPADGSGLTGVTAPYEAPGNPELRVSGHDEPPRAAAERIVEKLLSRPGRSQVFRLAGLAAPEAGLQAVQPPALD